MRKVEICNKGFYGGTLKNVQLDFEEGYFHGFFSEGNNEEGIEVYAIVERKDGTVMTVQTHKMKFAEYCGYEKSKDTN